MLYLNIIGLLFDIIGVLILYFNSGLSEVDNSLGFSVWHLSDDDKIRINKCKRNSLIGIILIIVGFVLQISTYCYQLLIL